MTVTGPQGGRTPPHDFPTHYPGRQWARDMNLWAEAVRANIVALEGRVAALEKKSGIAETPFATPNWRWPQE